MKRSDRAVDVRRAMQKRAARKQQKRDQIAKDREKKLLPQKTETEDVILFQEPKSIL